MFNPLSTVAQQGFATGRESLLGDSIRNSRLFVMSSSHNIDKLRSALSDKYEIVELIASGGMGEIYLGIHRVLGKKRAIKIIHQAVDKDQDIRQRFLKEARLAASIDHPGIIQIMDFGSHEAFDYLIMPYIEGTTLAEEMEKGPFEPERALALMIAMADALAHAHRQNIIHRDIKPSNFMLDPGGRIILTDFGISKSMGDPNLTATNMILGSPRFMSPEQISGKDVDKRSDLYSLGMIFYQMLTGRYPFEAEEMTALAYKQVNEVPPPPSRVNPQVPEVLSAVIARLLEKQPDKRFPDGDSLLKELAQISRIRDQGSGQTQTQTQTQQTPSEPKTMAEKPTRLVDRRNFGDPQETAAEKQAGRPDRPGEGGMRRIWNKRPLVFSAAGICLAALILALFTISPVKRLLPAIFGGNGSELALRSKESREKAFLSGLKKHNRPLAREDVRDLGRLSVGVEPREGAGREIADQLRRFLSTVPFVRLVDLGGCDVLFSAGDHALGKKLVINSNLYECRNNCNEELRINTDKMPLAKIEMLIKRNYCFNLFSALTLLLAETDRPGMELDFPGKSENVFLIGEPVQFCLQPPFKAHSMLLDINMDGIFKLFPLDRDQRVQLEQGETGCSRKVRVSPPMGNEMIVALGWAASGMLDSYSQAFDSSKPVFGWSYEAGAAESAVDLSEDVFRQLANQSPGSWAVTSRFIRVLNSN